jgi:hypothetical protein
LCALAVAESVKAGIEEVGGSATLYQCVLLSFSLPSILPSHFNDGAPLTLRTESPEPSPRKSSPRCTPLPSPPIPSSRPTSSGVQRVPYRANSVWELPCAVESARAFPSFTLPPLSSLFSYSNNTGKAFCGVVNRIKF